MRGRLALGLLLTSGVPLLAAVPPMVPVIPPIVIERLAAGDEALSDPAKLAERIRSNTRAATDKLAGKSPDADTRKAQWQAVRDIDELLKQMENQPPPPMPPMGGDGQQGNPPPPTGGDGGQPPPMGGGGQPPPQGPGGGKGPPKGAPPKGGQQSGKSGGQPQPAGPTAVPAQPPGDGSAGQPQKGQEPGMTGGPNKGGTDPGEGPAGGAPKSTAKPVMPLDDRIAKQVWGHLPDTVRKQMSQYYQEQFMPRYGGLLRDYYSAIAEREKQQSGSSPKR